MMLVNLSEIPSARRTWTISGENSAMRLWEAKVVVSTAARW